jgi:hypothetical protein
MCRLRRAVALAVVLWYPFSTPLVWDGTFSIHVAQPSTLFLDSAVGAEPDEKCIRSLPCDDRSKWGTQRLRGGGEGDVIGGDGEDSLEKIMLAELGLRREDEVSERSKGTPLRSGRSLMAREICVVRRFQLFVAIAPIICCHSWSSPRSLKAMPLLCRYKNLPDDETALRWRLADALFEGSRTFSERSSGRSDCLPILLSLIFLEADCTRLQSPTLPGIARTLSASCPGLKKELRA